MPQAPAPRGPPPWPGRCGFSPHPGRSPSPPAPPAARWPRSQAHHRGPVPPQRRQQRARPRAARHHPAAPAHPPHRDHGRRVPAEMPCPAYPCPETSPPARRQATTPPLQPTACPGQGHAKPGQITAPPRSYLTARVFRLGHARPPGCGAAGPGRPPEGGSAARPTPRAHGRLASRRAPLARSYHGLRQVLPLGLRRGEAGQPRRTPRPGRARVHSAGGAGLAHGASPAQRGFSTASLTLRTRGNTPRAARAAAPAGHRRVQGAQWSPPGKPGGNPRWAAWPTAAFTTGGVAIIGHARWLLWTCTAIIVHAIPAGKVAGTRDDTVGGDSTPPASHDPSQDQRADSPRDQRAPHRDNPPDTSAHEHHRRPACHTRS
jgi:hypothetical protein